MEGVREINSWMDLARANTREDKVITVQLCTIICVPQTHIAYYSTAVQCHLPAVSTDCTLQCGFFGMLFIIYCIFHNSYTLQILHNAVNTFKCSFS